MYPCRVTLTCRENKATSIIRSVFWPIGSASHAKAPMSLIGVIRSEARQVGAGHTFNLNPVTLLVL